MKNKILLTAAMAFIGIFTFSLAVEAQHGHGRGARNNHKHVFYKRGQRVVVWHTDYNQCGNSGWRNQGRQGGMCSHMNNIWRGGQCGNAIVRCNHRGCDMFGMTYRNGQFFGGQNNQGGVCDNDYYNQGRGRGGYNQGGGRGNGRNNQGGGGRGNGHGHGRR